MNDFDDFDNDTPPQGGSQEELDAELVMGAERQAEEDQMLAELAREEEDDRHAEQRRLDDAHRDQAQRDDDDRRDGIQSDIDRRDDWNRAEQERVARQAELDAEMEFSMGPEKAAKPEAEQPSETSEREAFMQGVRERHAEEMKAHAAEAAAKEAAEKEAHPAFYKGGFVDLKGNTVSAQDVNAILANHRASGGHQAAQERFGLANKGSELAAAHYAAQESTSVAQAQERQQALHAGSGVVLSDREQAVLDHLDRVESEGLDDDAMGQTQDWSAYMGMSEDRTKAVGDIIRNDEIREKARFLQQGGTSPEPTTPEALTEREEAVLHHVDRLSGPDADTLTAAEQGEDWGAGLSEEELQAQRERQAQSQGMELSR